MVEAGTATPPDDEYEISAASYEWSGRVFRLLESILRLNIDLNEEPGRIEGGQIFLFNHFARFETFIPQYLIYRETGAVCRSVAASDFFVEGSPFSRYLRSVGAVPTNHPRLLSFLGEEILRGRKVIVFPEGGMVKDRLVMDGRGGYQIYSRSAGRRRRHHTGAAVLGLTLDAFKAALLQMHRSGDQEHFSPWVHRLGLPDEEALLAAIRKPTLIVPANITFYPIRVGDNLLRQVAEVLSRGLSRRMAEELLIEGNILLRDTDMNVRMGEPFPAGRYWSWWEKRLINQMLREVDSIEQFFGLAIGKRSWGRLLLKWKLARHAGRVRDEYMHRIYSGVTVHLSHLASRLIMTLIDRGQTEVEQYQFHKTLYLALKLCQKQPTLHLHSSLTEPDVYQDLLVGRCAGFERFLDMASSMELIGREGGNYYFLPKLLKEHDFDEIRLQNLVSVYANEVAPISLAVQAVARAIESATSLDEQAISRICFQDACRSYEMDRVRFDGPEHQKINREEKVTTSGEPFLIVPQPSGPLGVVLVHGLLASPAEVRQFGERLGKAGYPVLGVRLKGHGTSPWDLRERKWEDWMASVRRGFHILSPFAPRLCAVGFSTGGVLSLLAAAEPSPAVAGVVAVSVPVKFRDPVMALVPLLHGANRITRWVSSLEGVKPFHAIQPEHPHINYRHVPIRSLYELQVLVEELESKVNQIQCPVLLLQGTEDPVVDPAGGKLVQEKIGPHNCRLEWIASDRHGILHEDIGGVQKRILSFLEELAGSTGPSPEEATK